MKTDLQLFQMSGVDFQHQLTNMAIYACYLSSQYGLPFCAHDIIAERDDFGHDYLNGFLHGICLVQSNPILCSKYIAIIPFRETLDYYLCKSIDQKIANAAIQALALKHKENLTSQFEILKKSYTINVNNIFSFSRGGDISQTSLNDDICLYSILYAYRNQIYSIPQQILAVTPNYSLVAAFGFTEGLKSVLKNDFTCSFDAKDNFIKKIKLNDKCFQNYTRDSLLNKYYKHYMYIDGILDCIEEQIKLFKGNCSR